MRTKNGLNVYAMEMRYGDECWIAVVSATSMVKLAGLKPLPAVHLGTPRLNP